MTKSSRRLRLLASAASAVTVAAVMPNLVFAGSAVAATASRLVITPSSQAAAAGTCMRFTVTATDGFGNPATDPGNIVVTLGENPASSSQDVDFCTLSATASLPASSAFVKAAAADPTVSPYYTNAPNSDGPFGSSVFYAPAASVTSATTPSYSATGSGTSPDNPDSPASAPPTAGTATASPTNNANPSGEDVGAFAGNTGTPVTFGVAGLTAGGATINAFFDTNKNGSKGTDETVVATQSNVTFSSGGRVGSAEAANAVTGLDAEPEDSFTAPNEPKTFDSTKPGYFKATLLNSAGSAVPGVTPSVIVTSKPAGSLAQPAQQPTCQVSDNAGLSNCAFTGDLPGVYELNVYVNQTTGNPTPGPDGTEPQDAIRFTVTRAPVQEQPDNSVARYIDMTPDTAQTTAGSSRPFTASVVSAQGAPVQGAKVTFRESGPGTIAGGAAFGDGTSTSTVTTDSRGVAIITILTNVGETGTETITASLPDPGVNNGCRTPAASPVPAGNCTDTSTNTIAVAPSPSPSASPTSTPTPTPTPTSSPSASPSTTSSSSASPSASASPACQIAKLTVNTPTINATGLASVTAFGVTPGTRVDLQGYSQDHFGTQNFDNDPTPIDRFGTADSNGTITFNDLRPSSNTRVRARQAGCTYGGSEVINVRTTIFLKVTRNSARNYTFDIDSIPARPGGLIVSIYRITGSTCAAGVEPRSCPGEEFVSQTRVSSTDGTGGRTLTFDSSYSGREQFVLKTGQDAQNAPGRSNVRDLAIY